MTESLTVCIPVYNDETTVSTVLARVSEAAIQLHVPYTITVINDGSTDTTGSVLLSQKRRIPHLFIHTHTSNLGYGATIRELYENARGDWLFTIPGDYQIDPLVLLMLWSHRKRADMIIGRRAQRMDNTVRRLQSRIYNFLLRRMFATGLHDHNSVRLMKTSILKTYPLVSRSAFVDAELSIQAQRKGFRVIEVPIPHRPRTAKTAGGGGTITTILPTIIDMVTFMDNDV